MATLDGLATQRAREGSTASGSREIAHRGLWGILPTSCRMGDAAGLARLSISLGRIGPVRGEKGGGNAGSVSERRDQGMHALHTNPH